ncbi:cyclic beta 1-2 glucan synthetase [Methanospirillum stamsii]|uniref:Cyclic beta 1-2 glucan synthetase n=1 Tax=Methanospirillum stamsii TaxID=1277351 RepID=A0A2V2N825_9EURY|nr:cyclic beta 1-2 glucan synthetase [Methanospirillum stamsii]
MSLFRQKIIKKEPGILYSDTGPIRDELYSGDQLIEHAKESASSFRIDTRQGLDRLLPRLAENEIILLKTHKLLNKSFEENHPVAPAGEWLLDNFYLVEEQVRTARLHLPEKFSKELPHMANGPLEGYPRVFYIARELIAHSDGRIDVNNLFNFIDAYQSVSPLLLGELWAVPIMLRLALIENLRRISDIISSNKTDRDCADHYVDRMIEVARKEPKNLILVIADMARSDPTLTSAFVAEMARKLQGRSGTLLFPLSWIEQRLTERNLTIELLINAETQAQAADQVSFGNSINSLRLLDTIDWRDFIERLSVVEHSLRSDSADVYAEMDFETRDRYRHAVEKIAKKGGFSEELVAKKAVELASIRRLNPDNNIRSFHVGYFLIDDGKEELLKALSYNPPYLDLIKKTGHRLLHTLYFSAIIFITFIVVFLAWNCHSSSDWIIALPFLYFLIFPVSQGVIEIVNWISSLVLSPVTLPKMDYSEGIPDNKKTIVVIPTVLSELADVLDLIDSLEIRYLANQDKNLYFALLTDLKNAPTEEISEDNIIVQKLSAGIQSLNDKYQNERTNPFFLMHRSRSWNPDENKFMGYERKRGILEAFSILQSGTGKNPFSCLIGNPDILKDIRYVITLDTDTELPRNSAKKLIGACAHPLNKPVSDPITGVIQKGYGILQPRVTISLSKTTVSRFVSIFGGEQGIDPYTRAVSDVYQDAFHEGSFIGKGIYDLEVFSRTVKGRFPENLILSHDLLEGCFARTGLVTDVQIFEEFPGSYLADMKRRHRWVRGDWQILPWLFPSVPDNTSEKHRNPLSFLSRWKIFDNLRRSLVAPATILLFFISWIFLQDLLFWTVFIVSLYLVPPIITAGWNFLKKPAEQTRRLHFHDTAREFRDKLIIHLATLTFLPYEAYNNLDAILRSCWRMTVSHRNLLEWTTHQEAGRTSNSGFFHAYRNMWPAPLLGIAILICMITGSIRNSVVITLFALAWTLSPATAWWISKPIINQTTHLSQTQQRFLRGIARKTWRFFETFVSAEDHYLPPDNYQEQPVTAIAHRTSPTDIGLSLLSTLAAYDFGYIPAGILVDKTQKTFTTMGKLKRFRGHFYNWYDTITLEPLLPRYISTVDSGNLVGDILVLRQGLDKIPGEQIISHSFSDGLSDTILLLSGALEKYSDQMKTESMEFVQSKIVDLQNTVTPMPCRTYEIQDYLSNINRIAEEIFAILNSHPDDESRYWAGAIKRQIEPFTTDLMRFVSWGSTGNLPENLRNEIPLDLVPYLSIFSAKLEILNNQLPTFREIAEIRQNLLKEIVPLLNWLENQKETENASGSGYQWLVRTLDEIQHSSKQAEELLVLLSFLTDKCHEFSEIEFEFLYDQTSNLLSIGYNATDLKRDASFYDLLASEARLTSFIGIARGQLPQEHWFALGRLLTTTGKGKPTLISWSGSMFEYLMPLLVMPTYENTLLDRTYHAIVARQMEYGRQRSIPWGISESGYNITDTMKNYQYRAFGVPGLGFKRGLSEDLVIAPYAAIMGLMVDPPAAYVNIKEMETLGYEGQYGFYEAVDFTPSRVPPGKKHAIVQSFMVHHQGMALLSLAYTLLDRPMQKRFEADPILHATLMLLQEKMPRIAPFYPHTGDLQGVHKKTGISESFMRTFNTADTPRPEVHLLSNGRFHIMITNSGSGYTRWNDLAITRWREDPTTDNCGSFCYIRDLASGEFWSNGYQPTIKKPDTYQVVFKQACAEFHRKDREFDTRTEIIVSPEDDVELRRIRVTNRSWKRRTIEFTSYAEVVLAPQSSDESHPAFSNLFVQTEIIREKNAILATRRPRSAGENPPWMLHLMTTHGNQVRNVSFETDRSQFIGRGNSLSNPVAMTDSSTLSDTSGSVLDPVVSIRCTITLEPQETAGVNIFTGVCESRDGSVSLIEKYYDEYIADRVSELAWTHTQVMLTQLNATERDAQLYGALASSIIYANPSRRAARKVLQKNTRGQSGLWGYGISGDVPIVLVRIQSRKHIRLIKEMVQAHAYWRMKGLVVDLVIWNEDQSGYRQELNEEIMHQMPQGTDSMLLNQKGGIFIRRLEQMSDEDRILIQTVARMIISDRWGTLTEQIERESGDEIKVSHLLPSRSPSDEKEADLHISGDDLLYFNGTGGFSQDGKEYFIFTGKGKKTPAPWINVIANENFGTILSESGSSYTWSENSHEFRLTPWMNDPVQDLSGEVIYIRDEETGEYWSPTPFPAGRENSYIVRHGFGYSVFKSCKGGILTELTVFVSINLPVKVMSLRIRNQSGRTRTLSVTGYVEWTLAELRSKSLFYVITETDKDSCAVFAKNPYNNEFPGRVAFLDSNIVSRTITGDRYEFIGRNRGLDKPAGMEQVHLSNKVGAGLDPCAAMQVPCELTDGEEQEIIFTLGVGKDDEDAKNLVKQTRGIGKARAMLKELHEYWNETLNQVKIRTPDPSVDLLMNGWLIYQTITCRLWARTGFYQSGGAFGFRDQLQDVMALIHTRPELVRAQLLLNSGHQFVEGDVQHWWHPPGNRGVRTRCSDDYLWLPFVTCRYVLSTNDTGILDEPIPYLEGRKILPDEDSYYDLPGKSGESGTLYEHCTRAIRFGLKFGIHGLPLIGTGDWNDGMNLVGAGGKGESVWLGFFLYDLLIQFQKIAELYHDPAFASFCLTNARELKKNLEIHGWDGKWNLRAYFDSGEPLGSVTNQECKIDSIAQSWAVLSGAISEEKAMSAMGAVKELLIRHDDKLITLFTPPFNNDPIDPGYIKGYVPGVRENGGHYSHAAIWVVMAFAALCDHETAWSLLPLINPVHHCKTPVDVTKYRVEPYVIASDIYAAPPHTGRGGWTWYSGSAGWMYTLILESLLGLRLTGEIITLEPCIPATWKSFQIDYRYRSTIYHIEVMNSGRGLQVQSVDIDGISQDDKKIHLIDDQREHSIVIHLGN